MVQDSTTVKLSEKLANVFPGGANQHGETPGVLRIQAIYDLLKQQWVDFGLSSYRRNDQKASPDILPHVQKGDLILRDLGYFAIAVLQQIGLRDAYFLSRYYFHTALFDIHGQKFDLLKQLREKGSLRSLGPDRLQRADVRAVGRSARSGRLLPQNADAKPGLT